MKLLFAVLVVLSLAALPLVAQNKNATVEKVITDLEYKWAEAQKVGNAEAVAPMLADRFLNTDADGEQYGKAQLLSNLKGGNWEQNWISDVKVTVFGDTAIASGKWVGKGVDGDGTHIDRQEHWTDTWVRMTTDKWQCVASQQTALKNK